MYVGNRNIILDMYGDDTMISHIKGSKFVGDKITLRDGKMLGIKETTQELLDIVDGDKPTIELIQLSFEDDISHIDLSNELQEIVDTIIDIGWNDELYKPRSMGYKGKDMYPQYVMECLHQGYQDYKTLKKYGLV